MLNHAEQATPISLDTEGGEVRFGHSSSLCISALVHTRALLSRYRRDQGLCASSVFRVSLSNG